MSSANNLRHVGKIKEAHGIRGEVFFLIFSKDLSWVDDLEEIYVGDQPHLKKLNIVKFREHKEGLILTLEDIKNRNQADELAQKQVWVDANLFVSDDDETPYLIEIENFEVIDKIHGPIGKITGFSWNGAQDILIVQNSNTKEPYEIPFVDAFVERIDSENEKLYTDLPEGLLDVNNEAKSKADNEQDDENN